jgi:hypothetical protein
MLDKYRVAVIRAAFFFSSSVSAVHATAAGARSIKYSSASSNDMKQLASSAPTVAISSIAMVFRPYAAFSDRF